MADIHILVADDAAGQRLDAYLGANDGCPTRSACAHLIEGGAVAVNGETCLSKRYGRLSHCALQAARPGVPSCAWS